eukprot:gene7802-9937_t
MRRRPFLPLSVPLCLLRCGSAIDNGLGLTPPMGWRSWNCYAFNISDAKI